MKYRFNLVHADKVGATNRDYFADLDGKVFECESDQKAYDYALETQAPIDKQIDADGVINALDVLLSACVERYDTTADEWFHVEF